MSAKVLYLEEVAEALTVSISTVRRLIKKGELAANKIGGEWRVQPKDVDEYLERTRVPSVAEARRAQIRALPDPPAKPAALRPGYWRE